jgi:hypothetical protein
MIYNISNATLMDGLVAYYPFFGNANDMSGNGNHATVHGATLTEDRFGNPNGAYELTGNYGAYGGGNFIEIPDMVEGLQNLSISMWVNEYEIGYVHGESYIMFGVHHNERVSIYHNRGGISGELGNIDFTISNNNETEATVSYNFNDDWRGNLLHYALIYDGENGILQGYINGNLIGEKSTSPQPITTFGDEYAAIGKHWWHDGSSNSTRFNGIFDDICI